MKKQIVFISGSAGFIGTNLTEQLLGQGYSVIGFDRQEPSKRFPGQQCISDLTGDAEEFDLLTARGDICDTKLLDYIFQRFEINYVVHLAALSTIQQGAGNREETFRINVDGTRAMLEAVRKHGGVHGFLHASTDKVYGSIQNHAYVETDPLTPVRSFYDQSKAVADTMVREWSKQYGLHGVVLRFCNIYGEYDESHTRIIPQTIRACLENRPCTLRVYRDAEGNVRNYKRDFLYVKDLCESLCQILGKMAAWDRNDDKTAMWGEAFNLGSGHSYSMEGIIRMICNLTNSQSPVSTEYTSPVEEIAEQSMNYQKANKYFGFAPHTLMEDGIRRTLKWWEGRTS